VSFIVGAIVLGAAGFTLSSIRLQGRPPEGNPKAIGRFTNVVYYGEYSMKTAKMKRAKRSGEGTKMQSTVRASISFPPDIYETLEALAKQKKVSLAWVVRDAAEKYIADRTLAAGE
jgi:hypothetical protein